MASPLAITVTADLSGLSKGMQDAARIARDGGGSVAAAFHNIGKGAAQASDAVAKFSKEQSQQARVVNRVTAELTSLVPMSKEATNVTRSLGGALYEVAAGGISFGAGLAAIGAAMAVYQALTKAASEQLQRLQAEQDAAARRAAEAADRAREALILQRQTVYASQDEARAAAERNKTLGDAKLAVAQLTDQHKEASERLERFNSVLRSGAFGPLMGRILGVRTEVANLARELAEAKTNYETLNAEAAKDEARRKGLAQYGGLGLAASAGISSLDVGTEDAAAREREEAAKRAAARYAPVAGANAGERTRYNLEMNRYRGGYTDADRERAQAIAAEEEERRQKEARAAVGQFGVNANGYKSPDIKELEQNAEAVDKLKEKYQRWGEQAGQVIADVITGHKSVGDTIKDLGKQAIAMGAKWAISQIMNAALKGGAEGAASSAQAGPPGVAAAPAVMASMIAMIGALAGSVLTAHGGADFAGFPSEFPMLGARDEMMLPPEDAETMRQLRKVHIDGEGRGAPVIQIRANDAKSFFDYFESNPREFRRRMERMSRGLA